MDGLAVSAFGEEKVPSGPRRVGVAERRPLSESALLSSDGSPPDGEPLLSFLLPTLPRRKVNYPATQCFWKHRGTNREKADSPALCFRSEPRVLMPRPSSQSFTNGQKREG